MMRGQASLEHLLLTLIALALLTASASALLAIRDMAMRGIAQARFHAFASAFSQAANELCALGSGNGREMDFPEGTRIESDGAGNGWVFRLSSGSGAFVRGCRCEVEPAGDVSGLAYVENKEGKITIRER
jgi:hypothetical protein